MNVEHEIKVVPITEDFQAELEKLQGEGWQLMPGIVPVVIYHVCRSTNQVLKTKPQVEAGAFGKLNFDESKIGVVRDGKLLKQ